VPADFWSREHGDACVAYVFRSAVQGKVCAALVLVAAGLLLTGPSASAARPGNDAYASARAVKLDSFTDSRTHPGRAAPC